MKHIALLAIAGLLLASCSSTKRATRETTETASTVTATATEAEITKITHRKSDTSVTVPPDSLKGSINTGLKVDTTGIGSDSVATHVIESGTMTVTATVNKKTGVIDLQAKTKERKVSVPVDETIIENDRQAKSTVQATATGKTEVVKTKSRTSYLWLWIALAVAAAYAVWRYRPTIGNIIQKFLG